MSKEKENREVLGKEVGSIKESKIVLHDKYGHDKINDDEFYREVLIYKVDGKISYMMSVIEGDGYSRAYNMDSDTYFNPENHEDYSDEIQKEVLEKLVELACKQIEIDYEEVTIEEMTRKFIERNGEELFRNFANTIVGIMHSDKWSATYDWMHETFTFLPDEKDGQIITKFVELVETNRL